MKHVYGSLSYDWQTLSVFGEGCITSYKEDLWFPPTVQRQAGQADQRLYMKYVIGVSLPFAQWMQRCLLAVFWLRIAQTCLHMSIATPTSTVFVNEKWKVFKLVSLSTFIPILPSDEANEAYPFVTKTMWKCVEVPSSCGSLKVLSWPLLWHRLSFCSR